MRLCRDPEYQKLLIRFKDVVGRLAAERLVRLRTIGVSDDWDVDAGIDFLRGMGPWDEIVAGNSRCNSAVIEHIVATMGSRRVSRRLSFSNGGTSLLRRSSRSSASVTLCGCLERASWNDGSSLRRRWTRNLT